MQKVMNSLFDISNLIELYEVLQMVKLDQENYFNSKQFELHYTKIDILFKYSFLEEIQQYLNSLAKHNQNKFLFNSIQSYAFFKSLEYNFKTQDNSFLKTSNYLNKLEQQYLQPIDTLTKPETIAQKLLYYSVKLLTNLDNVDKQFIKYYKLLENAQLSDAKMPYEMQMIQPSTLFYQIPFPNFAQIIASSLILIQILNNKQYDDFTEENYIYQTQLISKLKANRFHSQVIKSLSIMIDVTWNIINLSELVSASIESFTDSSIVQRMAFTFANVHRGFKVLKIVIDESIFKYFIEPIEIQYSDPPDDTDQKINFKPQVKIIFHGLEDINLENPKATKLNLEILVQIAENEYFQVGKDSDPVIFWNYDKLQQFNLISNILLTQIIQLLQKCLEFMPKDPKTYFDYFSVKAISKKFTIEKSELTALISKWFTAEKNHIKTSIDTIISFVEALEFNVIKTESTLQKDLQFYKSGGKPFQLNKDKFQKSLIGAGLQLHFDLIYKIEGQSVINLTSEIEMTLGQLQIHTGKIRQLVQMIKKSFISFK